ncbi:MAG: metallophosphoesterase family protein [Pseudomonadota bacterium]
MTTESVNIGHIDGRCLVFGGPYSNLQATEALRDIASEFGVPAHRVICTGDTVAYCGDPQATVDLVRDWGIHVVMGNCEESLGFDEMDCGCGFDEGTLCSTLSVDWYAFARRAVSESHKLWMKDLPRTIRFTMVGQKIAVIHGGLDNISEFIFASTDKEEKNRQILKSGSDIVICGHCGIPFGETTKNGAWLNAGVIGMPANDGTLDSWYMILEPDADTIHVNWHRLQFDNGLAAKKMQLNAMRQEYHDALLSGLWPSMDVLPETEKSSRGQRLAVSDLVIR